MKELSPDIDAKLAAAFELKVQGDVQGAIELFAEIDGLHRDIPFVVGMWGSLLWSQGKAEQALPILQRSVVLSPHSNLASLALFNALWCLDRREEALEEMRRQQLETGELLPDYQEILAEINEKGP
ncbi:tetratricopeptide repeat protein [bacterium]|nr:MAG: tetratricopeptide repeat protein [bacterium]